VRDSGYNSGIAGDTPAATVFAVADATAATGNLL
jgi:hypothetical protein